MSFSRQANPIWLFDDLEGNILDDSYYMFFLENTVPYLPQAIYTDLQGTTPWANPIQFLANGTLPENMYFDENQVYRLEVRRGPTQADPLIYLIENYVPTGAGSAPSSVQTSGENQISNPQFAWTLFDTPLVINNTGSNVYNIAPGWFFELTGTGTLTLEKIAIPGSPSSTVTPIPGNPPYVLGITTTGSFTVCNLVQRFQGAPAIWANDGVTASVTVKSEDGVTRLLTILYRPSTSTPASFTIAGDGIDTDVYRIISGAILLPPSTNTDSGEDSYVDIVIEIPVVGALNISNIQVLGEYNDDPVALPFDQQTLERQEDHLFHYYKPQLDYKPITSYLTAWDFPINPHQLGATVAASAIGANKSQYVWDQTILFQSANSGVSVSQGANGDIELTAAAATQLALIQYHEGYAAREILNNALSVNVAASGANTKCTVSLWYTTDASLPNIAPGTNNSLVATLDANGKPATFNGTWTEVPRRNGQPAVFTILPNPDNRFADYAFNGWDLEGDVAASTATYFAIVVGTEAMTIADLIGFQSISLVPGEIATRPAPEKPIDVFMQCQYYLEKSYPGGTLPGAVTANGMVSQLAPLIVNGGAWSLRRCPFGLTYLVAKRATPITVFYSPASATPGFVQMSLNAGVTPVGAGSPVNVASTGWTATGATNERISMIVNDGSEVSSHAFDPVDYGLLSFQYTADARLGIV